MVQSERIRWRAWLAAAVACVAPGCAGTLDTLTSQRFRESPFRTLFYSDDPMYVLTNVQEGDERAKAMRVIKEPKRTGGTDADQEKLMEILTASATADKQAVCRLGAIDALARFEDPRATRALVMAYHNAGIDAPADTTAPESGVVQAGRKVRTPFSAVTTFTPDQVITIQSKALEALGTKRSPDALALLCEIALTPPKKNVKFSELDSTTPGQLGQDKFDLRQAAIRALAKYEGDRQAALTLYKIMTTEKEIGPKSRAYRSLIEVTGKDFPPNSPQWAALLQVNSNAPPAGNETRPTTPEPTRLPGSVGP